MAKGFRTPSFKKSFSSRTAGKITRTVKKASNPIYGKKGMGLITNPKKSVYNKIYSKTTFGGISGITKSSKSARKAKYSSHSSLNDDLLISSEIETKDDYLEAPEIEEQITDQEISSRVIKILSTLLFIFSVISCIAFFYLVKEYFPISAKSMSFWASLGALFLSVVFTIVNYVIFRIDYVKGKLVFMLILVFIEALMFYNITTGANKPNLTELLGGEYYYVGEDIIAGKYIVTIPDNRTAIITIEDENKNEILSEGVDTSSIKLYPNSLKVELKDGYRIFIYIDTLYTKAKFTPIK